MNFVHIGGVIIARDAGSTPTGHHYINIVVEENGHHPVRFRVSCYDDLANGYGDDLAIGRRVNVTGRLRSRASRDGGTAPSNAVWVQAESVAIAPVTSGEVRP
jgi:single-stranded DNA-binding protein